MASPKKENGFTAIPNELFEAILMSSLTLRELKIVLFVIRYTYGFQRQEAKLSVRFIAEGTGIKFNHIATSIKSLLQKNILYLYENYSHRKGRIITLNTDYESWYLKNAIILKSYQKRNRYVPIKVTNKVPETVTKKENGKEKNKERYCSAKVIYLNNFQSEDNSQNYKIAKEDNYTLNEKHQNNDQPQAVDETHLQISNKYNLQSIVSKGSNKGNLFSAGQKAMSKKWSDANIATTKYK